MSNIDQYISKQIEKLIRTSDLKNIQMPNKEEVVGIKSVVVTVQDYAMDDVPISVRFEASARVQYKSGDDTVEKPCNFSGSATLEIKVNELKGTPYTIKLL